MTLIAARVKPPRASACVKQGVNGKDARITARPATMPRARYVLLFTVASSIHDVYRSVAATRTHSCAREAADIRPQPHSNRRDPAARCREGRVFAGGDRYR